MKGKSWIPTWATLHRLYGSLIGKAFFIISLAAPLAMLNQIGIKLGSEHLFLLGATFVALGFMIEQLVVPAILKSFASREIYASDSLERNTKKALDLRFEFTELSAICQPQLKELIAKASLPECAECYFPPNQKNADTLGVEKIIYYASLVNFELFNNKFSFVRAILILIFTVGVSLIYFKTAFSLFNIILGS